MKITSINIDEELLEWVKERADLERRSVSNLIAIALEKYREKVKGEKHDKA